MKVRIKLFGVLRVGRFRDEVHEYPDGTALATIIEQFQIPKEKIGIILVNGSHATETARIGDGDTLTLLPIISGG